jgi:hypothetical protein
MPPIPEEILGQVVGALLAAWTPWETESGHQCWGCGGQCTCMAYLQWPDADEVARVAITALYQNGVLPRTALLPGKESA